MLQGMTVASPPAAQMPSATSLQASALRDDTTTLAPSLASSSAEERPMPRLEPVTTATFPVRSNGVFFMGVGLRCFHLPRHCERSEAIQNLSAEKVWIASSHLRKIASQFCRELLAMTV